MSARRYFIGCTAAAVGVLVILIIVGVVAYHRLTTPVPLPESTRLVDADSVGHAVLRLEPDNPWIRRMFSELSQYSTREPKTSDLFPIEVVWSAHRASPSSEGHIVGMSFSPRGRLFGMMSDFALWRAGRSDHGKITRVVYGGEGITAFPGTPIPGDVFARDNSIVWSSDLATARRAVDLVVAREKAASMGEPATQPAGESAAEPDVMRLMPPATGHTLVGAVDGEGGVAARCLALLPGAELDVPEEQLAGASLSLVLDATTADVASGELTLHFPAGTPAPAMVNAANDLARRIVSLKWGQVIMEAAARVEPPLGVISIKASGLSTIYSRLLKEAVSVQRTLEKGGRGGGGIEPAPQDPNQSSSTFQ